MRRRQECADAPRETHLASLSQIYYKFNWVHLQEKQLHFISQRVFINLAFPAFRCLITNFLFILIDWRWRQHNFVMRSSQKMENSELNKNQEKQP